MEKKIKFTSTDTTSSTVKSTKESKRKEETMPTKPETTNKIFTIKGVGTPTQSKKGVMFKIDNKEYYITSEFSEISAREAARDYKEVYFSYIVYEVTKKGE